MYYCFSGGITHFWGTDGLFSCRGMDGLSDSFRFIYPCCIHYSKIKCQFSFRWSSRGVHGKQKVYCCHAFVIQIQLYFLNQRYSVTLFLLKGRYIQLNLRAWLKELPSCHNGSVALPIGSRRGSWKWLHVASFRGWGMLFYFGTCYFFFFLSNYEVCTSKTQVIQEGSDITLVGWGAQLSIMQQAIMEAEKVSLRWKIPFDSIYRLPRK